jgi:hypothetical protein
MTPLVMLGHDVVDAIAIDNPDAMVLLVLLERYHGGNDRFVLAKPMATKMGVDAASLARRPRLPCEALPDPVSASRRARATRSADLRLGVKWLRGTKSYPNITYTPPPLLSFLEHLEG